MNSFFFFPKEQIDLEERRKREIIDQLENRLCQTERQIHALFQQQAVPGDRCENFQASQDIEHTRLQSMMQAQVNNCEIERLRAEMQVQKFDYSQIVQNARLINAIGPYNTSSFSPQHKYYFADDRIYVVKESDGLIIKERYDVVKESSDGPTIKESYEEAKSDGYACLDPVEEIEDEEPSQKPSLLDRLLKKGRRL